MMKPSEILKLLWKNRILFLMASISFFVAVTYFHVHSDWSENTNRSEAIYVYKVLLTERGTKLAITDYPIEKDKLAVDELLNETLHPTIPSLVINSFSAKYSPGYVTIKFDFINQDDTSFYAEQLMTLILTNPNYNPYFLAYDLETFEHNTFDISFFNRIIALVTVLSSLLFGLILTLVKGTLII